MGLSPSPEQAARGSGSGHDAQAEAAATRPSVVVVNHNGKERLVNTVRALLEQPYPLASVIVCDSGSDDGGPAEIRERFAEVDVHELGGNYGPCRARNEGVKRAASSLVLLLDNDVYVQPDTIEKLVAAQQRTGAAVVCPRVRLMPESQTVQSDGAEIHHLGLLRMRYAWTAITELPAEAHEAREVDGAISACLLVDRTAYDKVGGFDELYFFYFEDLEFSVRTRLYGGRIICEPTAEVYHDRGEGTVGLSYRGPGNAYPNRRAYLLQRNRKLMILTHYRLRTLLVLMPALCTYELMSVGAALHKRFLRAWVRGWWWLIVNHRMWRARRRVMQEQRAIRDRDLLVGGPLPFSPGFLEGRVTRAIGAIVSAAISGYWRLARHWIG